MKYQLTNDLFYFVSGSLQNNTYILKNNKKIVIIDPSFSYEQIKNYLRYEEINEISILITHYHYDHIGNCSLALLEKYKSNCKIYISEKEKRYNNLIHSQYLQLVMQNHNDQIVWFDDIYQRWNLFDFVIEFIPTPVHTLGSTTYKYLDYFFTGDFIFSDAIGNFDRFFIPDTLQRFTDSMNYLNTFLRSESYICAGHGNIEQWKKVIKKNFELNEYWKK